MRKRYWQSDWQIALRGILFCLVLLINTATAGSSEHFNTSTGGGLQSLGLTSALALSFKSLPVNNNTPFVRRRYLLQYQRNGVKIDIHYLRYQQGHTPSLQQVEQRVSSRLGSAAGLSLLENRVTRSVRQNASRVSHQVSYAVPAFGKTINYRIDNIINNDERWMISASYKACDEKGKQLVGRFLNSLKQREPAI